MLSTGETYRDAGGDYFTASTPTNRPNASSPSSNASDITVTLQEQAAA